MTFSDSASEKDKHEVRWKIKIGNDEKDVKVKDRKLILVNPSPNQSDANDINNIIPSSSPNPYAKLNDRLDDYKGGSLNLDITEDMAGKDKGKDIIVMPYLMKPSEKLSVKTNIVWSKVGEFISLVSEVEKKYPDWTGEDVLNSLRAVGQYRKDGEPYDTLGFRVFYGGENPLRPGRPLPSGELRKKLDEIISHDGGDADNPKESGISSEKPISDYDVAMGHVLTGISGGQHRIRNLDFPYCMAKAAPKTRWHYGWKFSDALENIAGYLAGEKVDNLYSVTIAGDLGQSVNFKNEFSSKQKNYIGHRTEATYAEIIGDIDGFIIGSNLAMFTGSKRLSDKNGAKLSEVLHNYYCTTCINKKVKINRSNRFATFKKQGMRDLKKQTIAFAINFAYKHRGKVSGLFTEIGSEAKEAYEEFKKWIDQQ